MRKIKKFSQSLLTRLLYGLNSKWFSRLLRPFMAYSGLSGPIERLRNKESERMRRQFPLFVGYFKISINKKTLVGFLRQNCPDIRFIDLYRCRSREAGKAYCCKMTFNSKYALKRAVRTLGKRNVKGRSFVVREWMERTAANERRNVNWRSDPNFSGSCRRSKDRRRYRKPITLYVGN